MSMEDQGQYAVLYAGAANATATPTSTTEINLATTVALDITAEEVENTTRANAGYESSDVGNKKWVINFTYFYKEAVAQLNLIRDAFNDGTAIGLRALTSTSTAAEGPSGNWVVTQHSRNENMNERIAYDVVANLYSYPTWVEPT